MKQQTRTTTAPILSEVPCFRAKKHNHQTTHTHTHTPIHTHTHFAERTFSLARRLKTYLRANMRDERFNQLGLLAWYDDELLDIIKLEPIGNNYIQEKPDHRKKMFGQSFSSSDFEHKYFN